KRHGNGGERSGKLGLRGKETIVVYESGFRMRAAWVGWMLEYTGAQKVFLLEGGFQAWRKSHFPTENRVLEPEAKIFRIRPMSRVLATADEIRSDRSAQTLDVRSEGEFTGKEGRECDKRRGRISRARWLEWPNHIDDGKRL